MFDCIEEIRLETDKINKEGVVLPAKFQLVMTWQAEENDKDLNLRIELISPKGKVLKDFINTYKVNPGSKRIRIKLAINGMPIIEEGRYIYRISNKKGSKYIVESELPLDVSCIGKK